MKYAYRVLEPGEPSRIDVIEIAPPSEIRDAARNLASAILADLPMVRVQAEVEGTIRDMFVADLSLLRIKSPHMPGFNHLATMFYRKAWKRANPAHEHDSMPVILGTAVLFEQRVW